MLHTFSSTFSSLNKNNGSFLDHQLNPPKKTKRENVVLFFPSGSRGRQDGVGGYLRSSEWPKNIPTNLDNLATNHANHLAIGSMSGIYTGWSIPIHLVHFYGKRWEIYTVPYMDAQWDLWAAGFCKCPSTTRWTPEPDEKNLQTNGSQLDWIHFFRWAQR